MERRASWTKKVKYRLERGIVPFLLNFSFSNLQSFILTYNSTGQAKGNLVGWEAKKIWCSKIPSRNYHCLPWKELCRTGSNATSKYIIKSEGNFLCICYSLTKCIYELRFYRLKAKKKMISPTLEVRIRYKLEKVGFHCHCNF